MKHTTIFFLLFTLAGSLLLADTITDELLPPYFQIREKLAGDTMEGVRDAAKALAHRADAWARANRGKEDLLKEVTLIEQTARTISTSEITQAREVFKDLSKAMIRLHGKVPGTTSTVTYYCSMAPGSWMQPSDDIGNPYYGSQMLKCGKKIESRPVGSGLTNTGSKTHAVNTP